jgi:hypothetical protein
VDEVAKLAQSGVSEEVILTYVEKYPDRFNVTADQIVYLNDLGVSSTVVNAMMKHDGAAAPATAQQNVSNAPPIPTNAPPQTDVEVGGNAPIATAPAAPSTDVSYFYDSLAPYGSWIYVSGYGWCWQPTVAVRVATWQPYCDFGRWYWCDSGWYWHSDYSWGWAPFHYGRWYHHARCGWIWTPGTVWGPAWVSWRYSAGYCGWAPLPPAAIWAPGIGLTFHGRHVDVGFDFGLSFHHYAFVSVNHFCDPRPWHHVVPRTQVVNVYRNTTVINNYRVNNGAVVNRGVGRETIARQNPSTFHEVKVQQANFAGGGDRMTRVERRGKDLVVYHPQLPKEPPVKPAQVQARMANQARVAKVEQNRVEALPRTGRSNVGNAAHANTPSVAPRVNPGGAEPKRQTPATTTPRVERENRSPVERSTPQRVPQERTRSAETPRSNVGNNVARLNEAPATPRTAPAVRPQSPANVPSPRVERQPAPQLRSAPETRSPVTAPSIPRSSTMYGSPRYNEQFNVTPRPYGAPNAPTRSAPSYTPAVPHSAAPVAPRNVAPAGGAGHGGGPVHTGGGEGGGRGGGGRRNR